MAEKMTVTAAILDLMDRMNDINRIDAKLRDCLAKPTFDAFSPEDSEEVAAVMYNIAAQFTALARRIRGAEATPIMNAPSEAFTMIAPISLEPKE